MIIIHMQGGIGNELFIYGLYRKFQTLGVKVCFDLEHYRNNQPMAGLFQLGNVGIAINEYPNKAKFEKILYVNDFLGKVRRKLFYKFKVYQEKLPGQYDSNVFKQKNKYIMGYYQSYKYFEDISDLLKKEIRFVGTDNEYIKQFEKKILQSNSVSIHIRLTDYEKYSKIYGGICTEEYYRKSIKYIKSKITNPVFFVFSDDMGKAKNLLKDIDFIPVDINHGEKSYLDMYLMSLCKNNIIANSSFSWWGAWLNCNNEKIVIAPSKWVNNSLEPDICPPEWIRI